MTTSKYSYANSMDRGLAGTVHGASKLDMTFQHKCKDPHIKQGLIKNDSALTSHLLGSKPLLDIQIKVYHQETHF